MRKQTLQRLLALCSISCTFVLAVSVPTSQAQKLNRNRPGVYITFKEFVKKTADENNPQEGARLVLHNNTRWPIYYHEESERALPGDVAMAYKAQQEDGRYEWLGHIDVVFTSKLMPGKSVSFTVPRENFPERGLIYVTFTYSWEMDGEHFFPGEAEHQAEFVTGELPHWPQ
jgi:hypothetical protein